MHIWFPLISLKKVLRCFLVSVLLILGLSLWTCCFRSSGAGLNEIGQVKMTRRNAFYSPLVLKKKKKVVGTWDEWRKWVPGIRQRVGTNILLYFSDRTNWSYKKLLISVYYFTLLFTWWRRCEIVFSKDEKLFY